MTLARTQVDRNRARGALIGLAVGDALGATLEFEDPGKFPFDRRLDGPHREVAGGGPHGVAPGQVTDDTQMAVCLADSLLARGTHDPADAAARYAAWVRVAFDAGAQTRAVLGAIAPGRATFEAARAHWHAAGERKPAGNGSLMRTAPIGVRFARDPKARMAASLRDSALTHFDPRCQLACVALNGAIAAAISQRAPEPLALLEQAVADVVRAGPLLARARTLRASERRAASAAVLEDLNLALEDDPGLRGDAIDLHATQGFVRVALRLAFWELCHARSFEDGLLDVVNRGGDADTNGAVAGALLGALHGERAIPRRWRDAVLFALEGEGGPWGDTYHPRRLLALADAA